MMQKPAAAQRDHVFLVDGSSYIFRAYHALPPLTRKSDGLPVGALAGFCNMLWKLLRDMKPEDRPTHLAVVFDRSEHTFRNKLYAEYKAHRPPAPDDLVPQFPLIREAVRAFELPCLEQAGFEADDLIATYARQACARGATVTIVSSDKDLMQLVNDCVVMYDTMKDKRIGIPEVIEKFGVPPEKVVDVQALAGDSVDNVPGVPGIGVKTAAQLITEYGDLETLLERAPEIKQPKRREALIGNAEQARLSRRLVQLDEHVTLDVPLDDLAVHEPDARRLIAFLKAMEFTTLTRRVAEYAELDASEIAPDGKFKAGGPGPASTEAPPPAAGRPAAGAPAAKPAAARSAAAPEQPAAGVMTPRALAAERLAAARAGAFDRGHYQTVRSLAELAPWIARARDLGEVALDIATTGPDPMQAELIGLALACAPGEACYVPLAHRDGGGGEGLFAGGPVADQIAAREALAALKSLVEDAGVLKIGHNVKYRAQVLAGHGLAMAPADDIMLMSYVLDAGRQSHDLDALAQHWLGHTPVNLDEVTGTGRARLAFDHVAIDRAAPYAAGQADVTLRLWRALKPRLAAERMLTVYETLERPLIAVLMRMERRGIAIDRQVLARLSGEFTQEAARLEAEIQTIAGEPLNPGSPKQLGDILFGKLNLPGGRKTKTGAWSTSASVLEDLAEEGHALPRKILDWRQVAKLKSTYTDALPAYVNPVTHRVHTTYALAATTTGRLSSNEPNLQNIPVRTEDGRKIRRAFVATKGHRLVSADYSQIELRLLAEIADIAPLREAFREGLDIHAMTASEMFDVPIKDMTAEVRRRAKAINFGIIYGISAFGLANQLGIAREDAAAYIRKYFERFPGIRAYMDETREFCRANGYVTTLFGRKCHYPDIAAPNPSVRAFNERAAINARLQGTAADIIRRAMIRMEEALAAKKLAARMLLQVHDELIFEVPEDEVEATLPVVRAVMAQAPLPAIALSLPLQVDARAAHNWDEAH
ncbi:MAG: DNA polymerase I [Xanthobacteraceae bacterium]|nr:MAG: DNA polymerase I [Xanthobacteraceae bacterium]